MTPTIVLAAAFRAFRIQVVKGQEVAGALHALRGSRGGASGARTCGAWWSSDGEMTFFEVNLKLQYSVQVVQV